MHVISEENKLLAPYPPHPKNVTALPCKMHNFFVWLKVCCIPPNVGDSEKKPVVGWHWWLWKEPVVMCGKWNVRQATLHQMFKVTTFCTDTGFQSFPNWSTASSTTLCWNSAHVATKRFRNSSVSRIDTRYAWKKVKKMKNVCILQGSVVTFFRCDGQGSNSLFSSEIT